MEFEEYLSETDKKQEHEIIEDKKTELSTAEPVVHSRRIGKNADRKKSGADRFGLLIAYLSGVITVLFLLTAGLIYIRYHWPSESEASPSGLSASEKLRTIMSLIDEVYVGEVDEKEVATEMYKGLINGLGDRYSAYYTEEEYNSIRTSQLGHYKGIGVEVRLDDEGKALLVNAVTAGSPAEEAGILANDRITHIDGEPVEGKSLTDATALLKESSGETAVLTVEREGEILTIEVKLEELESRSVTSVMIEDTTIGYLRISSFTALTPDQFAENLDSLREQGAESLIVDLRNNPGGLLSSVCDTLRQVLPEGLIVYTIDKQGNRTEHTCDGATPLDLPLAVLVNSGSASASEIFTGAVQDYGIGTIVGTTTYGKGIVQDVYKLPDRSVVKLTIAHYYTPLGKDIHGAGITPDIIVEIPAEAEEDVQLQKAIEVLEE